jgi:cyanophycinase
VLIFDGGQIVQTNIPELEEGAPVSIENLIVHVLAKGYSYELKNRRFLAESVVNKEF